QVNPACEIRVLEDDPDRLKTFDRRLHGGRLPVLAADSTHARDARHPAQWSSHADGWAVRSYWAGWVRQDEPGPALVGQVGVARRTGFDPGTFGSGGRRSIH